MSGYQKVLLIFSLILGLPAITGTLLSILPLQYWWSRIFDFLPLQILACLFMALIIFLLVFKKPYGTKEMLYLTILLGAIVYHSYTVFPYTFLHKFRALPATVKDDRSREISIVYCNVFMENRESGKCLKELLRTDPDMILFVETDQWWANELRQLRDKYPHYAEHPLPNTYGMVFYSKLPFDPKEFEFLIEEDVPSLSTLIKMRNGVTVQCYFIHPKPPVPTEAMTSEERDAELMLIAKKAKASKHPVIVAGDLNDVGWSPSSILFQKNSQLLDPRIGRGLFATFNAKYPLFRWPLDHIFHSNHFRVAALSKLGQTGSDHFPIYIKLSYEPEGRYDQRGPALKKQDVEDANEKLNKVD